MTTMMTERIDRRVNIIRGDLKHFLFVSEAYCSNAASVSVSEKIQLSRLDSSLLNGKYSAVITL